VLQVSHEMGSARFFAVFEVLFAAKKFLTITHCFQLRDMQTALCTAHHVWRRRSGWG